MAGKITFEEWQDLSEITFEWADGYDAKDFERTKAILAPTLLVDYSQVIDKKWEAMPAADFLAMVSGHGFVGDPVVMTQHHIGASKFVKTSPTEVTGFHQLRAAHQRYTSPEKTEIEAKGHGHALIEHYYKKVDGIWKLAGLKPTVRWNEYDFEKIFKGH